MDLLRRHPQTFTYLCHDDFSQHNSVLVWLDDSDVDKYFKKRTELREIIHHIVVFSSINNCIEYISSIDTERVFVIITGTYANEFDIEQFHEPANHLLFYLLTKNQTDYKDPVRGHFVDINCLINKIREDYELCLFEDSIPVINTDGNSTRILNPNEIKLKCLQLLINVLRKMPAPSVHSCHKMLEHCRVYSVDRPRELQKVDDFQTHYSSKCAIKWFTRDCFLHPLISGALRTNNIDMIFDFGFIIADIDEQLSKAPLFNCTPCGVLEVFRGQLMTADELNVLVRHIGGYISNNTFFSTTMCSESAVLFAGDYDTRNPLLESVIFEITIIPGNSALNSFAKTADASFFNDKDEILFTIGNVFKIDAVERFNERWIIYLTLCDKKLDAIKNLNDQFDIAMLVLMEILPKLSPRTDRINEKMLERSRFYYSHDPIELAKIDQFEATYKSNSALRWYTKDSFLFRLLNMALRNENVDMILDFRYFIIDIYEELTKVHIDYIRNVKESMLTVYRGQRMHLKELQKLRYNVGGYMSTNTFFSASLSSEVALIYAELSVSDSKLRFQSVLFVIDYDIKRMSKHPFANISHLTNIFDEQEVIFPPSTQFRINNVGRLTKTVWLVHLTLCYLEESDEMKIMEKYLNTLLQVIETGNAYSVINLKYAK
ncbi:unnamed protein product [Didymodactylos carnosus]|uniref:Uncharacterized protein n=1 Tax=Didymodactylos carnosus TaxID=1234261 RepID=A0A814GLQ2_9BILA|nr:unnamed protein product [Didymodactylos carnosus]CAF3769574.1 unnamed protein product [Didymodactylos carnosus]